MLDNLLVQKSSAIAFISVVLNVMFSYMIAPLATPDQIKPPNGASELPFLSQIIHMLVHHKQVPITSSMIVFLVTLIAVLSYEGLKSTRTS